MPCRDDGPVDLQETAPAWMLCEAMVIIERSGVKEECSSQLLAWWRTHSKKEEDRVRKEAAAKLSRRELQALGLNDLGQPLKKGPNVR